jgi:hypothetical protein
MCAPQLAGEASADDRFGEGSVRFMKATSPEFDRFTSSKDPAVRQWIKDHAWRMLVYGSYFDDKNSWYPGGWVYKDLYAIYADDDLAEEHPEWVLRDANGDRLYIPWGCDDGACPQYAGDISNPAFRAWWIERARQTLAHGYKGLYIDDVNLDMRVSDGHGDDVAPIDSRTNAPMTEVAWRAYMADFVEQIRQAFRDTEIVHNAIWYAAPDRQRDPYVRRQIRAANWVNLERGVNDSGLTGGQGKWSLRAFFSYIDDVHALGRAVVLDPSDSSASASEYSLASYFLVDTGRDGVGLKSMTPSNWWPMLDVDLGSAKGARFDWEGLIRRDYAAGMALVNPPGAATRTVALPAPMIDESGAKVSSVTLEAANGTTLRSIPGRAEGSSGPRPPVQIRVRIERTSLGTTHGGGAGRAERPSGQRRLRSGRSRGWTVTVRGRVRRSAKSRRGQPAKGRVRIVVRRADGRRVRRVVRVRSKQRFAVRLGLPKGRYRLRARYIEGAAARGSARTRFTLPHGDGPDRRKRVSRRTA